MKTKIANIQDCISYFLNRSLNTNGVEYIVDRVNWSEYPPDEDKATVKPIKIGKRFKAVKPSKIKSSIRYAFTPLDKNGKPILTLEDTFFYTMRYLRQIYNNRHLDKLQPSTITIDVNPCSVNKNQRRYDYDI